MSRAIRQKKGETKFMKNEKNGQKQSWGFAVVLVCLVLVLSVGGVFLFLNVSEPKDAPAAPVGTEQLTRPSVSTDRHECASVLFLSRTTAGGKRNSTYGLRTSTWEPSARFRLPEVMITSPAFSSAPLSRFGATTCESLFDITTFT